MKTRVLIAHNYYRSSNPSGEARVVTDESTLLKQHGHPVEKFIRSNDELLDKPIRGTIKGAFSTPWNPFSAQSIKQEVESFGADIVHVHNTFPLFSPSIFHSIGTSAARVLTLHNYRLFCPAGTPLRNAKVCTQCIDQQNVWPSLKFGCYRDSRLATLPVALGVVLHRNIGTWKNQVDAFITLTEFQRDLMVEAGLPRELVHVKPNFYVGDTPVTPWQERTDSAVFAGRLTLGKGIESLVKAWMLWGSSAPELRIAGDGELRHKLEQIAAQDTNVKISFLGQLPGNEAREEIARSRLLVLPSQSLETFGLVILEAFASGTPAAVSDVGSLASIVQHGKNGVVFPPGNPQSLLETLRNAWEENGKLQQLGRGARRSFETRYTEQVNYTQLMKIYKRAIGVSRSRKDQ